MKIFKDMGLQTSESTHTFYIGPWSSVCPCSVCCMGITGTGTLSRLSHTKNQHVHYRYGMPKEQLGHINHSLYEARESRERKSQKLVQLQASHALPHCGVPAAMVAWRYLRKTANSLRFHEDQPQISIYTAVKQSLCAVWITKA